MIKKAIVLAAGEGTRLRPLTLAIPKEMIRVGTKPVIEHAINVLKAGGIREILVVVGRKKEAILDYLGSGERLGVDISYKIQEELKGTAHAVYQGKDFIGNEDFVVIYGDNYLKPYEVMKEIVKFHEEKRADATLVLHPVKDPRRFGIVKIDANNKVLGVIEKPTLEEAEHYKVGGEYLNIAGLLVLKPIIFDFIRKTKPGKDGEIWLTDSVDLMRKSEQKIFAHLFKVARYDIGTFESLMEADRLEQAGK
ncbi:UTP--glucose-1-phosphate uridylyltransferase [subsurface metagenome]